jgi:hypothetical protein
VRAIKIFSEFTVINEARALRVHCSVYSRCYATRARYANNPDQFLGNGSVNTFPLLGIIFLKKQDFDYDNGRAVCSTWFVPIGYKRDEVWNLVS